MSICLFVSRHTADGAGDVAVGERGEGARVEREREKLTREEASLRMAVQQMQRDIAQLQENITQLGKDVYCVHLGSRPSPFTYISKRMRYPDSGL